MRSLYGKFPREVGIRRKVIYSWEELRDYVKKNNGFAGMVSTSLYAYEWIKPDGKPDYESAILDKILSDFDPGYGYNPLEEARRLDILYEKHDVKRLRVFSGGGLHVLASAKPNPHTFFASATIRKVQEYLASVSDISGFDGSVGNYASQHIRILNTYNGRRKLYCIPLTDDQFWTFSMNELQELAEKSRSLTPEMVVGRNLFDVAKFEPDFQIHSAISCLELDLDDVDVNPIDIDKNCMKIGPNAGNQERFILISSLLEKAYSQPAAERYLQKVLSPDKFNHCVKIERQPEIIFKRNLVCFKCEKIRTMGLCRNTPANPCPYEWKD
ncbi:MAG: hypothetical protein PHN80_16355 [Hespellia sp.]|nr:hypothetical protein [Hespellia sp.]